MGVDLYGPHFVTGDSAVAALARTLNQLVENILAGATPATGSVTDAKVAADAAIAQSKIAGLVADLATKLNAAGIVAKAAATTNQDRNGLDVIDGYQTVAGDQVLLTAQTTPSENGPWIVAAGAWTRPADFATGSVHLGRAIVVSGGTLAGSVWTLNTTAPVTVGTTAQTWVNAPVRSGTYAKPATSGTLAARPAATVIGQHYLATDENGGTLYGSLDGATWTQLAAGVLGASVTTTKRATVPISGTGLIAAALGSITDWGQRTLVALPFGTTRWRLRIRNYSAFFNAPGAGPVTCTGVYLGRPSISDRWLGQLTAAPTQVASSFSVLSAADSTSEWVTASANQMAAGTIYAICMGFLGDATTQIHYDNGTYGIYGSGAGKAAAAANQTWTGAASRLTSLDIRVEYECEVPADTDHVLVIGTSIEQGSKGGDGGAEIYEAWPNRMALANGVLVTNLGAAGSVLADWTSGGTAGWRFARADIATTVPDRVIIGGWANDVTTTLATWQTNYRSLIALLRGMGIKEVWGATITPYAGTDEAARLAKNDWIRTIPAELTGIVDFDRALGLAGRNWRQVTDAAVTSGSAIVTSATANFQPNDVNASILGTGIPVGARVLTRDSATQVTMTVNATVTGAAVTLTVIPIVTHADPAFMTSYPHPDRTGYQRMASVAPSGR